MCDHKHHVTVPLMTKQIFSSSSVPSIRFSDVAVLLFFILLPSAVITLILIGRMMCPKKERNQSKAHRSPIEVTEG